MNLAAVKSVIIPSLRHLRCFVQYVIYFVADVFSKQLRGARNMDGINPAILASKKVISTLKNQKND